MLEWFTESAFFPSCIGVMLAIVFVGLAFSTGETIMLKAALVVALLITVLNVIEVSIVTDREQVENSLYDMASAMRQNDFEHVFEYLDREELVQRARAELRDATCHSCNITAIKEVTVGQAGESAVADFVAFARASNKGFPSPTPIQRRIKLSMEKRSGGWKIVDFETSDPRAGFRP
jgi:ketosteroid isomerase-like protein